MFKIRKNCSIDRVWLRQRMGNNDEVTKYLVSYISDYKNSTEGEIKFFMDLYHKEYPDVDDKKHFMLWIEDNVLTRLRGYVRNEYLGITYDVLKRTPSKYKSLAEIGISIEDHQGGQDGADYLEGWAKIAEEMPLYAPFFETHAHYNMSRYNKNRSEVMKLLQKAGVTKCIIPSVEAYKAGTNVNRMIKEMFDSYESVYYAFASHPKYIWRDPDWDDERWEDLEDLLKDPKCVAVGEAGLDYSYMEFNPVHQQIQQDFFIRFIKLANKHKLPVILHIRPGIYNEAAPYQPDVNKDALEILSEHPIYYGGVLHCFGGNADEMWEYYNNGVKYFGIGGRILLGDEGLESAVREMPAESILLETDSPYINTVKGMTGPNISLALLPIAERIADLRKISVKELVQITYRNAEGFILPGDAGEAGM